MSIKATVFSEARRHGSVVVVIWCLAAAALLAVSMPTRSAAQDMEYRVRHILVETEREALALIERLKQGVRFTELAKQSSRDLGSKDKGGDLGWGPANLYPRPFADVLVKLEPGKFSNDPVQTTFGWHVIALDSVRPLTQMTQAASPSSVPGAARAREIVENKPANKPGQIKKFGDDQSHTDAGKQKPNPPPPGKGTSGGGNVYMNSGTRRDGSMMYPTGVYFFRATFQGRFMGFEAAQAGSESEALGILRSGSSYQFNYDGGCPAGSKAAGPYWGKANFRAVSGGGTGHAWACGYGSEVDAGNAVIDHCIRTSCATSEQYMTLAIGNVLKQPQPLDQYLCADGHPGTRAGALAPRTGRGARSRRDPNANGSIQQFHGEDELCINFVRRWAR